MLDAFKGATEVPVMEIPKNGETEGAKARKSLLFEEQAPETQRMEPEQEKVLVGESSGAQEQSPLDEKASLVEDKLTHSQALDEANLMIDGVLLSDSELMMEGDEDAEDWEQGEIMDFSEKEALPIDEQEFAEKVKVAEVSVQAGNQSQVKSNEGEDTRQEEVIPENAKTGGAKKREGQSFVSPRKKLLAKAAAGAKQGDKAKKPSKPKNFAA